MSNKHKFVEWVEPSVGRNLLSHIQSWLLIVSNNIKQSPGHKRKPSLSSPVLQILVLVLKPHILLLVQTDLRNNDGREDFCSEATGRNSCPRWSFSRFPTVVDNWRHWTLLLTTKYYPPTCLVINIAGLGSQIWNISAVFRLRHWHYNWWSWQF